jgi:transcriptional regulator with XRE-family HTH domain
MEAFARRCEVALNTVSRWENSKPPSGESLETLYRLASKHRHKSARVFKFALDDEQEQEQTRRRMGVILDRWNVLEAARVLEDLWDAHLKVRKEIFYPFQGERDDEAVRASEEERRILLKLADLLRIDGKKEFLATEKRELPDE